MRRALAVVSALLLLVLGYATLDVYDLVPGVLTLAPAPDPAPTSPAATSSPSTTVTQPRVTDAGMPLVASGAQQPVPTTAGLQSALAPVLDNPALGSGLGLTVRDVVTGAHLVDQRADDPMIPASNLKLLAAMAVDATFGAGSTLTTKVVQGAAPDQVVLVAGGDTLLSPGSGDPSAVVGRAGLGDLASSTATALRSKGIGSVTVSLDLSYAPGPLLASTWLPSFRPEGITGAVATIGLASERAQPGRPGPADPTASVLGAFVAALRSQGVGATPNGTSTAPAGAATLASVTSAPVADQLAVALQDSDDALTESLARQAAYEKGTGPGFAETAAFVRTTAAALGVDVTGVSIVDSSGLSRQNQVPARVIGDVLTLGAAGKLPGMAATIDDLAVAGLSGTVAGRFDGADTHTAAGVVRAKTGTLTGVNALAGTVVTADGRLLTFAAVANGSGAEAGTGVARPALDRLVAVLASCGCR